MRKPVIIGVSGGSGSGKTSVSKLIVESFANHSILLIAHDSYYKDQSQLTFHERLKTNYDHPMAFETELLLKHLKDLQNYKAIRIPVYDYTTHTRSTEVIHQEPQDVIIIEGILILEDKKLRNLMDIKVYVDTDDDVRIIRRIRRDIIERERSLDSVIDQYLNYVKPAHHQFVEPSKRYADIIIPEGASNTVGIDLLKTKIQSIINSGE
ncbi:MAG: uridine kinase [Defluviitaleaceae bacterium]|nr:uridine kinase [Defluviitaleaceae bacterium]